MKSTPLKHVVVRSARNELRTFRVRAGLSQTDLGALLGYPSDVTVSRHELSRSLPPLLIALCYEIIFQVPVSEIFVGLKDQADQHVEQRLLQFEADLELLKSKQTLVPPEVAQKLVWLSDRRNFKDDPNGQ